MPVHLTMPVNCCLIQMNNSNVIRLSSGFQKRAMVLYVQCTQQAIGNVQETLTDREAQVAGSATYDCSLICSPWVQDFAATQIQATVRAYFGFIYGTQLQKLSDNAMGTTGKVAR